MGLTCSSWCCCRAAASCLRSRRCSRTGTHLRHTCRSTPGIYPSKRTSRRKQGQRIRSHAQRVKREHSSAPFPVHAEILEMHILRVSRWRRHAEGQPRGGHSMAMAQPPPVPAALAGPQPHPLAPGSCSAPARQHLPCTSGRGPP